MKSYIGLSLVLAALMSTSAFAKPRLGVELTSGMSSLGVLQYDDNYGVGAYLGGSYDNAALATNQTFVGGWAELRSPISVDKSLFFAYGVDLGITTGKIAGDNIKSAYHFAPFVSLEKHLTDSTLLTMWTDVVSIDVLELENKSSVTTTRVFSTNLALIYYFN